MLVSGPHCGGCVNSPYGISRILPEGSGSSGIMLTGDSPWHFEQAAGHPFAGASGQLLDRILKRLSIDRSTLTITNSMLCSPPFLGFTDNPKRHPEALKALQQCEGYLQDTIAKQQPKVIVCLGGVAMRQVIGVVADITQRHSYVHETAYSIPAIPTFHPSYLLQNKHKLEICLMFALRRAQEVADGSYRESRYNLLLDPPIDAGYRYLNDHLRGSVNGRIDLLMVDIETPESSDLDEEDLEEKGLSYHIDRAGFSLDDHSGITFPFKQPYIDLLQEAINVSDRVAEWADNHFDSKRLKAAGLTIPGRIISGMWAWHFYQSDLLKGLGFVAPFFYAGPPWKHLASSQPAIYNAYDQVIGRACTVGSMDKLAAEGRLDRFMRHCVDADRIYVQMGSMGVMIDTDHQSKFIGRLKVEYDQKVDEIQPLIPDGIKPIKLWKKAPKDMTGVIEIPLPSTIIDGKMAKEMIAAAKGTVTDREFKAAKAKINELRNPYRYKRVDKFNINSPIQMKDLIRSLGLKVPKDRDGETTGAKHLKRFSKYPIFHTILQAKQRGKLISSYNWPLTKRIVRVNEWLEVDIANEDRSLSALVGDSGEGTGKVENEGTTQDTRVSGATGSPKEAEAGCLISRGSQEVLQETVYKEQEGYAKVGEEVQTLAEASLCPSQQTLLPHMVHVRGSWTGEATRRWEDLPTLPEGQLQANHPSYGHGQVKQYRLKPPGSMYFMPQQIPQQAAPASTFLLPVTRAITVNRVTTCYGWHPSTWRKSSRNVNLQVIPKRSDLADEFRRMIVAAPGHYLVTSDSASLEAVLTGYDANSPGLIRLAKAGIHDWLVAAYHGVPIPLDLPDADLTKACKAAKKKWPKDHDTFKRIVFLSTYLGTPYRIYEEYPEEFNTPLEAGKLQDFYFSTPPGKEIRQWQSRVMQEAHTKTYLDNHFQYRHYFYSVFRWDSKSKGWIIDHDGDAKRAVAFRPQSDGSAVQTEIVLRVAEGYEKMLDYLRLIIHDELVLEVPEDHVEAAATILHTEMTRPIPELPLKDGGLLAIGAETKVGRNLAAYNEETNPTGMKEMVIEEIKV